MKLLATFVALTAMVVTTSALAFEKPTIAKAEDPLPATTLTRKGLASKLDSAVPLFVIAENGPKTQAYFRGVFAQRGFTLANEPGPGVKTLKIGVNMLASVIKMQPMVFNIDDFIVSPDTNRVAVKSAEVDTSFAVSNAVAESVMLATGMTSLAAGVTGLATSLVHMSGIGGAVNEALVGDPRGVCIWPCDDWDRYIQIVTLTVNESAPNGGTATSSIKIVTKDEKLLYPVQLFRAALGTLSSDLLGDPMPQVFSDSIPPPEPKKTVSDSGFSTGL